MEASRTLWDLFGEEHLQNITVIEGAELLFMVPVFEPKIQTSPLLVEMVHTEAPVSVVFVRTSGGTRKL